MGRHRVEVAVPALALRRAEAAASLGVSVETFDRCIRPHIPAVRTGTVTVYPVAGLQEWLASNGTAISDDLAA